MPLDSYLRDLLGGSTGLHVEIVNDNAACLQEESSMSRDLKLNDRVMGCRSRSLRDFVRQGVMGTSGGKPSRWSGENLLARRKSDSALGKPQRRRSVDENELWTDACATLLVDLEVDASTGAEDQKESWEVGQEGPSSGKFLPLRSFSESRGKKSKKSERLSIRKTQNALHRIRSRGPPALPSQSSSGDKDSSVSNKGGFIRSLLGEPPSKPTRRQSSEELTFEAATKVVQDFVRKSESKKQATISSPKYLDARLLESGGPGNRNECELRPFQTAPPTSA